MKAGLDPHQTVEVIGSGAGTSRVFELRAPMMAANNYLPATMRSTTWKKDLTVIGDFASGLGCPTPLFGLSRLALYGDARHGPRRRGQGSGLRRAGADGGHRAGASQLLEYALLQIIVEPHAMGMGAPRLPAVPRDPGAAAEDRLAVADRHSADRLLRMGPLAASRLHTPTAEGDCHGPRAWSSASASAWRSQAAANPGRQKAAQLVRAPGGPLTLVLILRISPASTCSASCTRRARTFAEPVLAAELALSGVLTACSSAASSDFGGSTARRRTRSCPGDRMKTSPFRQQSEKPRMF